MTPTIYLRSVREDGYYEGVEPQNFFVMVGRFKITPLPQPPKQ
jgi:hypothetical protein